MIETNLYPINAANDLKCCQWTSFVCHWRRQLFQKNWTRNIFCKYLNMSTNTVFIFAINYKWLKSQKEFDYKFFGNFKNFSLKKWTPKRSLDVTNKHRKIKKKKEKKKLEAVIANIVNIPSTFIHWCWHQTISVHRFIHAIPQNMQKIFKLWQIGNNNNSN